MITVRRCILSASPFKSCAFYATRTRGPPKRHLKKMGGKKDKKIPFHPDFMFGINPGVNEQVSALELTEEELRDPQVLEDMEQQFWNVDKLHDIVEKEEYVQKELLGIFQVKRKQFKEEKCPNLLLWDERNEIKTLHAQDPEKWTVTKLAFSYPATPTIIKKILKNDWKLTTQEEVEKYDQRVRKNWEALTNGELRIPNEDLKKHLMSFSNRSKVIPNTTKEISLPKKDDFNPVKGILKDGGVFGEIYNSYKQQKERKGNSNGEKEENIHEEISESSIEAGLKKLYYPPENDTFIIPKSVQNVTTRTTESVTLKQMQERVAFDGKNQALSHDERNFIEGTQQRQRKNEQKMEENIYEQLIDPVGVAPKEDKIEAPMTMEDNCHNQAIEPFSKALENRNVTDLSQQDIILKKASKFLAPSFFEKQSKVENELFASMKTARIARNEVDSEEISKAVKSYMSYSTESYPLQIVIPQDLWKKGALYRVKDRFYTDDGEFLYRVPGLSKE